MLRYPSVTDADAALPRNTRPEIPGDTPAWQLVEASLEEVEMTFMEHVFSKEIDATLAEMDEESAEL